MNTLPESALYLINLYAGVRFSENLLEEIKYNVIDKKIIEFKVNVEDEFMLYRNFIESDVTFEEFIDSMVKPEKKVAYIDFFSNCECCHRHTYTGKTRRCEKVCNLVYIHDTDISMRECTCPCRHYRRFIERSMR